MATGTGGTVSATGLVSLVVGGINAPADVGAINNLIFDDRGFVWPTPPALMVSVTKAFNLPGAFNQQLLYVPNRGVLKVYQGDIIMVDNQSGWPVLISQAAAGIAGTAWSHT